MSYIQTSRGKKFDLITCLADEVEIEDIAHALSNTCRFAGHVPAFYSVAQHSAIMSELATPPLQLQALLHDASEAYTGDLPRHVKEYIGAPYRLMEARLMDAISTRFGFAWPISPIVKTLDNDMLETEFARVFGKSFPGRPTYGRVLDIWIDPMPPREAEAFFLRRFADLTGGAA